MGEIGDSFVEGSREFHFELFLYGFLRAVLIDPDLELVILLPVPELVDDPQAGYLRR